MAYTPPGETRRKVYNYMRECLLRGEPPTVREVQKAMKFRSVESARSQLEMLVEEGALVKIGGKSRGYRLPGQIETPGTENTPPLQPTVLVPLVGSVEAGELTEAIEEPEGYLAIHTALPEGEVFALRVRGESMVGVGIFPDDIVIVERQESALNGDIVVALVGDEATVKTFRRTRDRKISLEPANRRFKKIVPAKGELRILGRVVEVRRFLDGIPLIEAEPYA